MMIETREEEMKSERFGGGRVGAVLLPPGSRGVSCCLGSLVLSSCGGGC